MRYLSYAIERDAETKDVENLQELETNRAASEGRPSLWKDAGVTDAGESHPAGVWPGKQVGEGIRRNPIRDIATALYPVRRHTTTGEYLVRDDDGDEVNERDMDAEAVEAVELTR